MSETVRPGSAGGGGGGLQPGARVGGYLLEEELGRGGMGKVFAARQEAAGRRVALKVVLAESAELSAEGLERFRREGEAVAKLNHPGIVKVYQLGVHQGFPFLAMDLVDGESLKQRLDRSEPYQPRPAAQLVAKLARAMQHAHDQGILHRDLKPANVLLDGDGRARIADFGLARDEKDERQRLTQTGQMLGTPAYMPPEQADGDLEAIGPRSDVYSLGAILYATLTGRPPFQGDTPLNVIFKVLKRDPEPPETDAALRAVCLTCLAKKPDQRYASAAALADDLERYLAGEPVLGRPPIRRWVKRAAVGVALTFVIGSAAGWGLYKEVQDRRANDALDSAVDDLGLVKRRLKAWEESGPVLASGTRELDDLRERFGRLDAPEELSGEVREVDLHLRWLEGLAALAQGDAEEASAALAALHEAGAPAGRLALLRGAIATQEREGNPAQARAGLVEHPDLLPKVPDVVRWRALARARALFDPTPEESVASDRENRGRDDASAALKELDALAEVFSPGEREQRARAWAKLRLSQTEAAEQLVGVGEQSPALERTIALVKARAAFVHTTPPDFRAAYRALEHLDSVEGVPWDLAKMLRDLISSDVVRRHKEIFGESGRVLSASSEDQKARVDALVQLVGMAGLLSPEQPFSDDLTRRLTGSGSAEGERFHMLKDKGISIALTLGVSQDYAELERNLQLVRQHLSSERRRALVSFARRAFELAPPAERGEAGVRYMDFVDPDDPERVLSASEAVGTRLRDDASRKRYHELRGRAFLGLERWEEALEEVERGLASTSRQEDYRLLRIRAWALWKTKQRMPAFRVAREILLEKKVKLLGRLQLMTIVWEMRRPTPGPRRLSRIAMILHRSMAGKGELTQVGFHARAAWLYLGRLDRPKLGKLELEAATTKAKDQVWPESVAPFVPRLRDVLERYSEGDETAVPELGRIVKELDEARGAGYAP